MGHRSARDVGRDASIGVVAKKITGPDIYVNPVGQQAGTGTEINNGLHKPAVADQGFLISFIAVRPSSLHS